MDNGKWVTINGRRVFIKDKNFNIKEKAKNRLFGNKEQSELKPEWNGKNEDKLSYMSDSMLKEELRDQLEQVGLVYPVSINDKTTGFFSSPQGFYTNIGREAIEIETSGPSATLNSKIWNVKLYEKNAKTREEKEVIEKLKKKFKDYL